MFKKIKIMSEMAIWEGGASISKSYQLDSIYMTNKMVGIFTFIKTLSTKVLLHQGTAALGNRSTNVCLFVYRPVGGVVVCVVV